MLLSVVMWEGNDPPSRSAILSYPILSGRGVWGAESADLVFVVLNLCAGGWFQT